MVRLSSPQVGVILWQFARNLRDFCYQTREIWQGRIKCKVSLSVKRRSILAVINGVDVARMKQMQEQMKQDPAAADREPKMEAHWLGGSATHIKFGDVSSYIGGDGNLNAMQTLLASLAACDIDLVAMHAALIGLPIDKLSIEISGHFNTRSYFGVENAPGSGYDRIAYTVHIKAPKATPEQIKYLKERCERSSPVGDSLSRSIPLTLKIKSN